MQAARPQRMRPRRCASATAGSWGSSTRLRIGTNCNGHNLRGERSHPVERKVFRRPDVVPEVTMPATDDGAAALPAGPARATSRAYLVWGIALVAYAVAVFHRASLGV